MESENSTEQIALEERSEISEDMMCLLDISSTLFILIHSINCLYDAHSFDFPKNLFTDQTTMILLLLKIFEKNIFEKHGKNHKEFIESFNSNIFLNDTKHQTEEDFFIDSELVTRYDYIDRCLKDLSDSCDYSAKNLTRMHKDDFDYPFHPLKVPIVRLYSMLHLISRTQNLTNTQ
jgi:hypothetical protein